MTNTAHATADDPSGDPVVSNDDSTSTPTSGSGSLTLDKTAETPVDVNVDGLVDAGDTIQYDFAVTNTGAVTVSTVAVVDPLAGPVTCPVTALAPGDTTTCTADSVYVITQADVDNGSVDNTAHATGQRPNGNPVVSNDDSTTTPTATLTGLSFTKSAGTPVDVNGDGRVDAGDTIAYSFTVTNTGVVTLDNVVVHDPLAGPATCDLTTLAPGDTATCAADNPYVITQADTNNGSVDNTAHATGTAPTGGSVVSNDDSTSTPTDVGGRIRLAKFAGTPVDVDGDGRVDAGDTIQYTFTVTNTGTVTVDNVAVADPLAGPVSCDVTTLAPGAVAHCTADAAYVITQSDVDSGAVDNTATASATDPSNGAVQSAPASTSTPTDTTARMTLDKSASAPVDRNHNGVIDAGDTIVYHFLVTNTGSVTMGHIHIEDSKVGRVSCPVASLAPGASTTCTSSPYVITSADVDRGSVDNTATATATPSVCAGGLVCGPVRTSPDTTETMTHSAPSLDLRKRIASVRDANGDGATDVGDAVRYSFTVTNTGNLTLHGVTIIDALLRRADVAVGCPRATLAAGQQMVCRSAPYTITAADQQRGFVANVATAQGSTQGGTAVDTDPSKATLTLDSVPGGGLPNTGSEISWWMPFVGGAMVVLGLWLVVRRPRRQP